MANPSKQKGTGGETELLRILQPWIPALVRAPASSIVDLKAPGDPGEGERFDPIRVLATRPDRGRWLLSVEPDVFGWLYERSFTRGDTVAPPLDIEVKRFARFAHHSIFEEKFGSRR